jgi:hypothetical protein
MINSAMIKRTAEISPRSPAPEAQLSVAYYSMIKPQGCGKMQIRTRNSGYSALPQRCGRAHGVRRDAIKGCQTE